MLFNSYEFIFLFLPLAAGIGFALAVRSRMAALSWLVLASLLFYAWWRPVNVLIIAPSIAINYILARAINRLGESSRERRVDTVLLVLGIAFNVAFLGYFKYRNFVGSAVNDVFGTSYVLTELILPLGISFIAFQKIAFLIDVHGRRVKDFTLQEYCLFTLFFPQLIAGPIVHFREIMPQFREISCRFDKTNVSVGLTLFFFGLFKKTILADSLAPVVTSIYEGAESGVAVSLLPAWMAAVGFTLQIYFDFSGYTDMALGAARIFGVRLPPNFNSPLQATSIIDFWLRWHMTLTRFLTAYIYNPLLLTLTRRRLGKGLGVFRGRGSSFGSFVVLLMLPTLLTMSISGLWHGASYLFVLWGMLHGLYLCINHAWRVWGFRLPHGVGPALTLIAVVTGMVLFRSETVASAANILMGMIGVNGIGLPVALHSRLASVGAGMLSEIAAENLIGARDFVALAGMIAVLTVVALKLPNSLQLLGRFEPALSMRGETKLVAWNTSVAAAIATSVVAAICIYRLGAPSEFLYWQF
jgi:alginate O-acetyltransferase complex protein AlgI